MFKKLQSHLLLSLLFFALTLIQQYGFYFLKGYPIVWFTVGKYFGIYAFFLAATFIRPLFFRFLFLSFVMILNLGQMSHLSYFGTQILPNEFLLLLTQFDEIKGTLLVEFHHVLIPMLFTLIPIAIGFMALRKSKNLYGTKVLAILFCLYFIYNPVRTFVTGNTWGRQPSTRELAGMNVYLSFSYFMGKILPHKMVRGIDRKVKNASTELKLTPTKPEWDKIIVILGESLSPYHMSLYGYAKPTTPFLESLSKNPNFFHTTALSGGVSTDIAVAFFLNMGFGEAGSVKAANGKHCLFKLAKELGFKTSFISIQSSEQLRYIAPYLCAASLDNYLSLEDVSPNTLDHQAAQDVDLLVYLEKIIHFDTQEFIVLHQRGSHGPWELRSRAEHRIFPHEDKVQHYDNSVHEFDLFMQEYNRIAAKSKKKILTLYISDHGEALGQDGKWGHGQLIAPAFEIPFIVQSFNKDLPPKTKKIPKFFPHYNIALYLAQAIGYTSNQEVLSPVENYVIFGNDIDGFAGKADILFRLDGTYDFKVTE